MEVIVWACLPKPSPTYASSVSLTRRRLAETSDEHPQPAPMYTHLPYLTRFLYLLIVLILSLLLLLSCVFLLSQAVRTSPSRNWTSNFNALVIGAAYIFVVRESPRSKFRNMELTSLLLVRNIFSILPQKTAFRSSQTFTNTDF